MCSLSFGRINNHKSVCLYEWETESRVCVSALYCEWTKLVPCPNCLNEPCASIAFFIPLNNKTSKSAEHRRKWWLFPPSVWDTAATSPLRSSPLGFTIFPPAQAIIFYELFLRQLLCASFIFSLLALLVIIFAQHCCNRTAIEQQEWKKVIQGPMERFGGGFRVPTDVQISTDRWAPRPS